MFYVYDMSLIWIIFDKWHWHLAHRLILFLAHNNKSQLVVSISQLSDGSPEQRISVQVNTLGTLRALAIIHWLTVVGNIHA